MRKLFNSRFSWNQILGTPIFWEDALLALHFPYGFDTSDVFVFVLHAYTVRFQIVLRPHLRYTIFFWLRHGCVVQKEIQSELALLVEESQL